MTPSAARAKLVVVKIYLVRHAEAVSASMGISDGSRFLSLEGRQTARRQGRLLREEGVVAQLILCSPLVRAVQTAELVGDAIDYLGTIESFAGLVPGCEPQIAAAEVASHAVDIMLVSHEPTISTLAAHLIGQPSFQPFRPGQVVLIENGRPSWRLKPTADGIEPQF